MSYGMKKINTNIFEKISNKDKPNGYAGLDENGNLNLNELLIWLGGI